MRNPNMIAGNADISQHEACEQHPVKQSEFYSLSQFCFHGHTRNIPFSRLYRDISDRDVKMHISTLSNLRT